MFRFSVLILFSVILLDGCSRSDGTVEALKTYINDPEHGLSISKKSNDIEIRVTYMPTDLWVDRETDGEVRNSFLIDSLRNAYSARIYFLVSFSNAGKEALQVQRSFGEILQTMSFRMADYASLKVDGSYVELQDCVLNRTYGFGASTDMLFVFDRHNPNNEVVLKLREFGLHTGDQSFRFAASDIMSLPPVVFI